MKLLLIFFGKFERCMTEGGVPYPEIDWRTRFVGRSGLIKVYESEHTAVGKKIVFFIQMTQTVLSGVAGDIRGRSAG